MHQMPVVPDAEGHERGQAAERRRQAEVGRGGPRRADEAVAKARRADAAGGALGLALVRRERHPSNGDAANPARRERARHHHQVIRELVGGLRIAQILQRHVRLEHSLDNYSF